VVKFFSLEKAASSREKVELRLLERATPLDNPVGTLAEYPRIHYVATWCTLAAVALASWTIEKFRLRNGIQTTSN